MQSDRVRVALDTSVLVPLFSVWHGFHEATVREYERLRRERVQFVAPTHALLECFSVLTRLPGDYRMPSDEAKQLLEENFSTDAIVPGIDAGLVWSCVAKVVQEKVAGGRVYDAIIAHSAVRAGAVVLVTWNVKDFLTVAPPGLEIREPGGHSVRVPRVH